LETFGNLKLFGYLIFSILYHFKIKSKFKIKGDGFGCQIIIPYNIVGNMLNTKRNEIFNANDVISSNDLRRQTLNIDSRFRTILMNSTTDFTFKFANIHKNVIRAKVASLELPRQYYVFSYDTYCNTFFKVAAKDYNGVLKQFEVRIADGNYSPQNLIDAINNSFEVTALIPFGLFLYASYNPIDYKVTITFYGSFELKPGFWPPTDSPEVPWPPTPASWNSFSSTSYYGHYYIKTSTSYTDGFYLDFCIEKFFSRIYDFGLGFNLGFRGKKYKVNTTGTEFGSFAITCESCIDTFGFTYFFLCVDDFNAVEQNLVSNNFQCLAKLILKRSDDNIVFNDGFNMLSDDIVFPSPIDLNQVRVRLLDPYGNPVNLNDVNFSFSLELTEVMNTKLYEAYRNYIWLGKLPELVQNVRGSGQPLLGGRGP
jgi:hypothetical protein